VTTTSCKPFKESRKKVLTRWLQFDIVILHTVKTHNYKTHMRTLKALLCLSALAGGIATSVAQSNVYSLNIVGYVNVPIAGANALTLISNPLKPSNGNYNITNTITLPNGADGAGIFKWAGTAWDSNVPTWIDGFGWYPDATINLGEAFFIQSPIAATITFVGEVSTGTNTTTIPSGLSVLAPKVPVAEPFPGVGHDGDGIFTWAGSAWNNLVWGYIDGYGWYGNGGPGESTNGPVVNVGGGVFYQNTGTPLTVTRILNP
jgi:hypothetical protein